MEANTTVKGGYTGKILRVDLTLGTLTDEETSQSMMRSYVGGVGFGATYLYQEVPPGTEWSDPGNRLIFAAGPLNGTRLAGSGTICVVTKGTLTNGAASSQANGFFGAYLKFSGYDAIVIHGAASELVYLYVHDGVAEIKDAATLKGKDTWETDEQIKTELNKDNLDVSVLCVGPAGENLVKFASIMVDKGHAAGHNGVGAVMGSKKLKAVVVDRCQRAVKVHDNQRLREQAKNMIEEFKKTPDYEWGTSWLYSRQLTGGTLPVRNLTTNIFPEYEKFLGENYRSRFELVEKHPCWACPSNHCNIFKVKNGPYAGYIGEEPEYEAWAAWSSLIGSEDVEAAFVLSNLTDRLGLEVNETGWLFGLAIECFEKGLITEKDTGGIYLNWGNTEAIMAMIRLIARREGFGDVLAEGVMRAARKIGGDAPALGVYHMKGNAPRGHDHRSRWTEMLDVATSNTGTLETGAVRTSDIFSPEETAVGVADQKGLRMFVDSLVMCQFPSNTMVFSKIDHLVGMLNSVTGWDFTVEEAQRVGVRTVNLLRAFNIRHGITPGVEFPSVRYSSAPVDGPGAGKSIAPFWDQMLDIYYKNMGWDRVSGKPRPETLRELDLDFAIKDIW